MPLHLILVPFSLSLFFPFFLSFRKATPVNLQMRQCMTQAIQLCGRWLNCALSYIHPRRIISKYQT